MTGKLFYIIQLLSFLIVSLGPSLFFKKKIRFFYICFFSIIFMGEIFSLFFLKSFIDYRVYTILDFKTINYYFPIIKYFIF